MKAEVKQQYGGGYGAYYGDYSYNYRRRRSKADWAGVGLGDAFKSNLDYYIRLPAQRLFYRMARKVQAAAARMAGVAVDSAFKPEVKPQLAPYYTNYPSMLSAYAALGLTGFLEYKSHNREKALIAHLEDYLENPAKHHEVKVDPKIFNKVARIVAESVQARLLLEELSRFTPLSAVEIYRLFSASHQSLKFHSLPEIVQAVILHGDLIPDWRRIHLHPMTRAVLRDVEKASSPYLERLPSCKPQEMIPLGTRWVKRVCRTLAAYLPGSEERPELDHPDPSAYFDEDQNEAQRFRFSHDPPRPPETDWVPPLGKPHVPFLFDPPDVAERAASELLSSIVEKGNQDSSDQEEPSSFQKQVTETLSGLKEALEAAGGQSSDWEDMRADRVERALRRGSFERGPIEGSPTDGHEVQVRLSGDEKAGGEIFDRPVELSDDLIGYRKLFRESQPVTDKLKRTLYPNIEERMEPERHRSSGSLDPARLALAEVSQAVFKRYHIKESADLRGRPVLLIACDGSASLSDEQMKMTKVLAAAWLNSTVRSGVRVLAGFYHSGEIRRGVSGPLVQWVSHPCKSNAGGNQDAIRALVSLPDEGTGAQSDALALAFMLEEARRVARGSMIYLILISDCAWNRSFNTKREAVEEVRELFESSYKDFSGKLHATLVALDHPEETGLEGLADSIIKVPKEKLEDYAGVAEEIGVYVATCMKERHTLTARS